MGPCSSKKPEKQKMPSQPTQEKQLIQSEHGGVQRKSEIHQEVQEEVIEQFVSPKKEQPQQVQSDKQATVKFSSVIQQQQQEIKPEIKSINPIVFQPSKQLEENPAKYHLECIKNMKQDNLLASQNEPQLRIGIPQKDGNCYKYQIKLLMIKTKYLFAEFKGIFRNQRIRQLNVKKEDFVQKVSDEDVHSRRFQQILNPDEDSAVMPPITSHRFNFQEKNMQKMDLSDLYRIDFDNSEKISIVPTLIEPLESIVLNPGIYPIDSFKNHHNYNYMKYISKDSKMELFDSYIPPSKDQTLQQFAKTLNLRYCVSTSTFSNVLCQIYYLISGFKSPDFQGVFDNYPDEPRKYMISQRKPTSTLLNKIEPNLYTLDGDPGIFEEELFELLNSGKIVERQLTQPKEEFESRYVKLDQNMPPVEDFHRFMELNNELCLRSQIDCRNRSDNPFVFEIKARGACPIRYDYPNFQDYLDYQILTYKGLHSSFEREYYDLIRGAFLKWAFQLKIGRMDGAFVAYHNLVEIQGFEYIKSSEIYKRLFGTEEFSEIMLFVGSRVATKMFDELIKDIGDEFETLKIGLYAQCFTRKLVMFVEIFKDKREFQKVFKEEKLRDEYDYYLKNPLKNKVLKYEFLIKPEINGIEYSNPITFRKTDLISIKYKLRCLGEADFGDYMNFLHDCYKHEEVNVEVNYSGAWYRQV